MGPGNQNSADLFGCQFSRSSETSFQSLLSTKHREWPATFLSSTEQEKRQQDLQTVVSLLVNSWPLGTVLSSQLPVSLQARLAPRSPHLLLCYFLELRNTGVPFETNPDLLGPCKSAWHRCLSAPSFWSLEENTKQKD